MKYQRKLLVLMASLTALSLAGCASGAPDDGNAEKNSSSLVWNDIAYSKKNLNDPIWQHVDSIDELIPGSTVLVGSFKGKPTSTTAAEIYGAKPGDDFWENNRYESLSNDAIEVWEFEVEGSLQGKPSAGEIVKIMVQEWESDTPGLVSSPKQVGDQETILVLEEVQATEPKIGTVYTPKHPYYLGSSYLLIDNGRVVVDPKAKLPLNSLKNAPEKATLAEQLGIK